MPTTNPHLPPPPSRTQERIQHILGKMLLAPGEAVRMAARLDRKTLAWGALALAAVLTLSGNLVASMLFRNVKADMTEDRLFTISDGTRHVLSKIDEPITMRLYYTRKLGEVAPLFGKYFERVRALLEQYQDMSGGKLQLSIIEPEPFSDAEDRAVASGLRGIRLNQEGETGYFGLAASNTTDNDAAIDLFSPDRERFLEYDLTKLIYGLAHPKKRVVGMMAGIPIDGGANPMAPMRQPSPPWAVMQQVREFFDVRSISQDAKEIPADIDVMLIVQPNMVTKEAAYALDQFVLRGGRILAFVDPVTETSPGGPMGMSLPPSESFLNLMKAWGVALDPGKVAGDPTMARRVQFGGPGGRPVVTDYLAWLKLDKSALNEKDVLAASIERMYLASAGFLTRVAGATTAVEPVLQTSDKAGAMVADALRVQPDPLALLRDFKPGGKPLMLAVRISGETKTAFPDGPPKKAEPKAATPAKDAKAPAKEAKLPDAAAGPATLPAKDQKAASPAAPAKDAKSMTGPATAAKDAPPAKAGELKDAKAATPVKSEPPAPPQIKSGRVNVVIVADTDMLNDQFWVQTREFLGQRIATPQSHNAAFLVNALESLSGGEALASLRGRGVHDRPFTRVEAIRKAAEQRYREKEQSLNAKLKDLQGKLSQIQTRGGENGAILLTEKDKQAIDSFRGEMITVRRELRGVQSELRRDIDSLDGWLKFFNIAAVPLVIGIGGLAFGYSRRRRQGGNSRNRG